MRAPLCCLVLMLLLPQCGGAATGAGARSADDHEGARAESGASDEGTSADADGSEADTEPSGPNCDDGTCSLCGEGICPSGWYCDEQAGACSWLTECAQTPSCACVTRVLGSSCKCREEGGGLKVACE